MKKIYIIILIAILVICLIFLSVLFMVNKRKSEELEAIELFEKNIAIRVSVRTSVDNIDDIKNKLESMEYVKSIELVSKEDELQNLSNKFSSNDIDNLRDILPNSFIIKPEINNLDDLKKIKIIEKNLRQIDEIDDVFSSDCSEMMKVYEKKGIKGLREYDKVLTIIKKQGVNAINDYLEEHKETRELLKDFIHF